MKRNLSTLFSCLMALTLFLSACGGEAQTTPDVAAISTAAAQTVEARFTQQAVLSTDTPLPPTTATPSEVLATPTLGFPPTETTAPGLPTPTSNGKICYDAVFVADVTIPDGMIISPGATFTKTWRLLNNGNCTWDQTYALQLVQGDPLGSVTKVPLTQVVRPGQTVDISIDMVAPTQDGYYSGYWRIATPFGGSFGVGSYDQAILVKIQVTKKVEFNFNAVSVAYDWTRKPAKGCTSQGAYYTFSATITANAAGMVYYQWDRNPFDGQLETGKVKFTEAGSKTVYFTWHMTPEHLQTIDRWVALTTIVNNITEVQHGKVTFRFTCD